MKHVVAGRKMVESSALKLATLRCKKACFERRLLREKAVLSISNSGLPLRLAVAATADGEPLIHLSC